MDQERVTGGSSGTSTMQTANIDGLLPGREPLAVTMRADRMTEAIQRAIEPTGPAGVDIDKQAGVVACVGLAPIVEEGESRSYGQANCTSALNADLLQVLCHVRALLSQPAVTAALGTLSVPHQDSVTKPLLDEPAAAAMLGIPPKVLGNLRRSGQLPATTYMQRDRHCRVLYVRDALMRYFNTRRS